jgi:hypothetical protein
MSLGKNKYQSRENRARVRELFFTDWDPIGVNGVPDWPHDECAAYADRAYVMLMDERASAEQIAAYLMGIATRQMGLTDETGRIRANSKHVAARLIEMRPEFETH